MADRDENHSRGTCDGCGADLASIGCTSPQQFGDYTSLCSICYKDMSSLAWLPEVELKIPKTPPPSHYKIILDEKILDDYLATLPALEPHEVWYACLFGRHKYDESFPNNKEAGQLARVVARDTAELKEKLRRLEAPVGSYSRDGTVATQECLAVYMAANPRSLVRANKNLLIELATRFANGHTDFNPVSLSTTCIHRAVDRKFFVDFDYDYAKGQERQNIDHTAVIKEVLPGRGMFRVLRTRGGFHVLVNLSTVRHAKPKWHQTLSGLPGCDVRGSDTLIPVPGCTQGGFVPYFIELQEGTVVNVDQA